MKKSSLLFSLAALFSLGLLAGCKKPAVTPATELLRKAWRAQRVTESGTVVYNTAATPAVTTKDYGRFRLNFTSPTAVSITEFEGTTATGTWALSNNDQTITITAITPAFTGVTSIVYTNVAVSDSQLTLRRADANPKTGASNVDYVLIPQ